jgi:hypothetical protein
MTTTLNALTMFAPLNVAEDRHINETLSANVRLGRCPALAFA